MPSQLEVLQAKLVAFADERDWAQFQSPKNLSMSLAIEAAELMEHFQWLTEEESRKLDPKTQYEASLELADVFIYTLLMASRMNIDLAEIAEKKLAINAQRYPADLARGSARKYTAYQHQEPSNSPKTPGKNQQDQQ